MAPTAMHADFDTPESGGKTYSITDLCEEFSVTPRALRFYEDEGLISPRRQGKSNANLMTAVHYPSLLWRLTFKSD